MSVHVIKMPDIGEGIAEVEVVAWHVKPGDRVREDQALADVMTDKAAVEIPSPVDGTVIALGANAGDVVAVGAELLRLDTDGAGAAGTCRARERATARTRTRFHANDTARVLPLGRRVHEAPQRRGFQGLKVDFHAHTKYSRDSTLRPSELIERARAAGLDRIAVTDHNRMDGAWAAHALDPSLIILGEEVDCAQGEDLIGNAARVGAYFQAGLRHAVGGHPLVGDVRGLGLMAGVELVADRATKRPFDATLKVAARVAERCLDRGLIVRALPSGTTMAFSPPLCINPAQVDEVLERFGQALDAVADELTREGTR